MMSDDAFDRLLWRGMGVAALLVVMAVATIAVLTPAVLLAELARGLRWLAHALQGGLWQLLTLLLAVGFVTTLYATRERLAAWLDARRDRGRAALEARIEALEGPRLVPLDERRTLRLTPEQMAHMIAELVERAERKEAELQAQVKAESERADEANRLRTQAVREVLDQKNALVAGYRQLLARQRRRALAIARKLRDERDETRRSLTEAKALADDSDARWQAFLQRREKEMEQELSEALAERDEEHIQELDELREALAARGEAGALGWPLVAALVAQLLTERPTIKAAREWVREQGGVVGRDDYAALREVVHAFQQVHDGGGAPPPLPKEASPPADSPPETGEQEGGAGEQGSGELVNPAGEPAPVNREPAGEPASWKLSEYLAERARRGGEA